MIEDGTSKFYNLVLDNYKTLAGFEAAQYKQLKNKFDDTNAIALFSDNHKEVDPLEHMFRNTSYKFIKNDSKFDKDNKNSPYYHLLTVFPHNYK